jgi:very-short-patch-repair endonuclease
MSKSALEAELALQIRALGLPEPIREYQAITGRKFRFDFAWLEHRLLVEVNGGTYTKGAHSTGQGIARDYEKANLATLDGWRVLMFDGKVVKSGVAVEVIRQALEAECN